MKSSTYYSISREREVLRLTASEERLLVFVILHWSNLAFDREITLKRTKKVSSIISSKKILSQVTVSLKNGQRRVQIAQSAIISLNIVNGSLGRESALFVWWAERREKSSTLMEKAAANPPAASHMKREDDSYAKPFNELRMCCIKKLKRKNYIQQIVCHHQF